MEQFLGGLQILLNWQNFLIIPVGLVIGIVVGAIPGLTSDLGIILCIPLTYGMDPTMAILMLLAIYCGGTYGGSITAILINTPGTSANAATLFDGYPMTVKGQAFKALQMALYASTIGGLISAFSLLFLAPLIAKITLLFGPAEYFALAVFGLSIITSVSAGNVIKGIMGGILGLFLATVGIDAMSGAIRFTLDTTYLMGGVSFIPILIGVFALSQALQSVEDCWQKSQVKQQLAIDRTLPSPADLKRCFVTLLRSSAIGTFIGCVPGTGGDIASFVAYDQAKRWSKYGSRFGTGEPEGIVAPEAGNNAVSGGAFIPVLTLGIPGDGATAIMMGALMVQGLQPGPLLFSEKAPDVYAIFIGLLLANVIMACMGYSLIRLFVKVTDVPQTVLLPLIIVMTFVGTYSYGNSMNDVLLMVVSGFAGYILNKLHFSMSAVIIGIILGGMAEQNFVGSLIMSDGNPTIFFTRPISLFFLAAAAVSLAAPFVMKKK
mgnify:CR=1 FL=1